MNIRSKLTLLFVSSVAVILLLASISIYYFSADYRHDDFYNRMRNKGRNAAKLLIEVEEIDAELLARIEADNPQSLYEEKVTVINYRDEWLFSTDTLNTLGLTKELFDEIRLGKNEVRFERGNYEVLGFMFADTYDRFVVVVAAIDLYGLRKMGNLRNILMVVFFMGVLIATVVGWFYAGRALAPISKVVGEVNLIGINNLDARLDVGNSRDEITIMAETFNSLLDRLENGFALQKNFIANASHEMRTPLTAMTGQLEVLLMRSRDEETYRKGLQSVLDDMKDLNRTSNRLLLLAQASSETAKSSLAKVRIDEIVWQARTELLKRKPDYKIEIRLNDLIDSDEQLELLGNDQLLKTAVINLMDNGCKYSINHKVLVQVETLELGIELHFVNQGFGIAPGDEKQIFEPFHRGQNSHTTDGHGIGLSLVKRIVELHNGQVVLLSGQPEHTEFRIALPSAILKG